MQAFPARFVWRGSMFATLASLVVLVTLTAVCASRTARIVIGAQPFTGRIVAVEKPVFEQDKKDFRPVVEATDPSSGTIQTLRFTGMYRVDEKSVGQAYSLLYNAATAPSIIPASPLNWIGAAIYGSLSLAVLAVLGLIWMARRWVPSLADKPV